MERQNKREVTRGSLNTPSLKRPKRTGEVQGGAPAWTGPWNRKEMLVENWRSPNQAWSAVSRNVLVWTGLLGYVRW